MPNPKLARLPIHELPDDLQAAHEKSIQLRGDATFFEVFANNPSLYRWYTRSFYGEVFRGGSVARRVKELVRLRLSTQHGCRFCNQGNRVDALEAGLTEDDLAKIDDFENSDLSEAEKAALRLADQLLLTNDQGSLHDQLYAQLRQHYNDAEILELGMIMGILSGIAKFMFVFDLVEKEEHCPFPKSKP